MIESVLVPLAIELQNQPDGVVVKFEKQKGGNRWPQKLNGRTKRSTR